MHRDNDGYTSVRTDIDPLHALTVFEFAKVGTCVRRFQWSRGVGVRVGVAAGCGTAVRVGVSVGVCGR